MSTLPQVEFSAFYDSGSRELQLAVLDDKGNAVCVKPSIEELKGADGSKLLRRVYAIAWNSDASPGGATGADDLEEYRIVFRNTAPEGASGFSVVSRASKTYGTRWPAQSGTTTIKWKTKKGYTQRIERLRSPKYKGPREIEFYLEFDDGTHDYGYELKVFLGGEQDVLSIGQPPDGPVDDNGSENSTLFAWADPASTATRALDPGKPVSDPGKPSTKGSVAGPGIEPSPSAAGVIINVNITVHPGSDSVVIS